MDAAPPFHPVVRAWFARRYGAPTPVQSAAWAAIAAGDHVLATAPTGGGKTLAAFLWAIDSLLAGRWEQGVTRVLYISPLKALNTDVRRNLLAPLTELARAFADAGLAAPAVRAEVRSGDTPASDRARLLRHPPEILVTTPESLNLMLLSAKGRAALGGVRTLILDEIHAVAGDKRGAYLMSAVERVVELSGEFQRVALSATVRPLEVVAAFVGGQRLRDGVHAPRPVRIVAPSVAKRVALRVSTIETRPEAGEDGFWTSLTAELRAVIAANRATLVFCNSRRMTEKLARFLNDGLDEPLAYAHHGSLARELRAEVEQRPKEGALKAVVATGSLELGIDVGEIDEVILIQTPPSLSAAIQRVGRAGHSVGAVSRGRIYPTHAGDLLSAAAAAPLVEAGRGEAIAVPANPLDVLAQVLTAMCVAAPAGDGELYDRVRCCASWATLTRAAFDLVLAMLLGRWRGTRLRELMPRLRRRDDGALVAAEAATPILRMSGGVIPDRGLIALRVEGSNAKIGELDEEFVWERHIGDTFAFGAQAWRIQAIGDESVTVVPTARAAAMAPFWRNDSADRGGGGALAVGALIGRLEPRLDDDAVIAEVAAQQRCDPAAAQRLVAHLRHCRASLGRLPHTRRIVVETCPEPDGDGVRVVIHALWGARALRPWALALAAELQARSGVLPETLITEQAVMLRLAAPLPAHELVSLVPPERIDALVRARLPQTGYFGACFRQCAGRALLLPRSGPRRRTPLWLTRARAKRLLEAVSQGEGAFPIVAECWRECLDDRFDLPRLREQLAAIDDGTISVAEIAHEVPSAMADDLVWKATNTLMYEDDRPQAAAPLSERVLDAVIAGEGERPLVPAAIAAELERKLARTEPGYVPVGADDVVDLIAERVVVDEDEWFALGSIADARLARLTLPGADRAVVVARENLAALVAAFGALAPGALDGGAFPAPAADPAADRLEVVARILAARGAIAVADLRALIGTGADALEPLVAAGRIVRGALIADDPREHVCDRDQYARLLRMARAARRPRLEAIPAARLPWLRARWQGLARPTAGVEGVRAALDPLVGACLPAAAWEEEVLPARVADYQPALLDALLQAGDATWYGCGEQRIALAGADSVGLFQHREALPDDGGLFARLWSVPGARYDLLALAKAAGLDSAAMTTLLWRWTWQGHVANDGFAVVRQGLRNDFAPSDIASAPSARHGLRSWSGTRPFAGAWRALPDPEPLDRLGRAEADKVRARQLMQRHGVLFRELCAHEPPPLQWGRLLPALRLLELSGEIVAGHFIAGPSGLQFALPAALPLITDDEAPAWWWHHAGDPASCCGLDLPGLDLPPRLAGTHLVWRGAELIAISRRSGRQLDLRLPPGDPAVADCLRILQGWLARAFAPQRKLAVETIDGEPAARSAHRPAFVAAGFYAESTTLVLRRSFG